MRVTRSCTAAAVALLLAASVAATEQTVRQTWEWEDVPRVVALGDIHGSYDKLVSLLRGAGLVDDELTWIGGQDHLVLVGDILDRLGGDRAIMDLLRRLQTESADVGGRVHTLLGNHEVMNLVRDLRYVSRDSYEHFRGDETSGERLKARRQFLKSQMPGSGQPRVTADFERNFPPGYFGRVRALNPDGEYGSWLIGLPVVVKVNGVVYVHGGFTEKTAGMGVAGINEAVHEQLLEHLEARTFLEERRLLNPAMQFPDLNRAVSRLSRVDRRQSGAVHAAAEAFLKLAESDLFTEQGPLWYRGNSLENERVERWRFTRTLELLGATKCVVAHSPTRSNTITSRFEGRLLRVDHGMAYGNKPLALVLEGHNAFVFDPSRDSMSLPRVELPNGERPSSFGGDNLSNAEIEKLLAEAKVVGSRDLGRGSTRPQLLELEQGKDAIRGVFKSVEEPLHDNPRERGADRYQHEVAAYRLARQLGMNFVPVTVVRDWDGRRGSLQAWIESAVDQESVITHGLEPRDPERVQQLLVLGRVFDALIGNWDRKPSDLLYVLDQSQVMCIDHSRAFTFADELWWGGREKPHPLSPTLAESLRSLDVWASEELGPLLSERQIEALLIRRDKILEECAAEAEAEALAAGSQ